jgi:diaminopimelate epimerase
MQTNTFIKTHGLGNDYIVLDSDNLDFDLTDQAVIRICDEHFGIGSDGILLKVPSDIADFGLLIYNPDGSKAENCGNGLRIFSKYLHDYGFLTQNAFTVDIMERLIHSEVLELDKGRASKVRVEMGKAIFSSPDIPLTYDKDECMDEVIAIEGKYFNINCVSMGNPHCVVLCEDLDVDELMTYAPQIQALEMFPNGTNVQFAKVLSSSEVEIRIYERGAGYTLASGSSSCGVAATMVKRGLVDQNVTIKMPGGELKISVDQDFNITMTGPIREICSGVLNSELIEDKDLLF